MPNKGFIRVAAAVPEVKVADCMYNAKEIINIINGASEKDVSLIVFPELALTSASCGDLYGSDILCNSAQDALLYVLDETYEAESISIIGMPLKYGNSILNVAAVVHKGAVRAFVPKVGQSENRFFSSVKGCLDLEISFNDDLIPLTNQLNFSGFDFSFAVKFENQLANLNSTNTDVVCFLSNKPEIVGRNKQLKGLLTVKSALNNQAYIYAAPGFGESSTDDVFAGNAFVVECGSVLAESDLFHLKSSYIYNDIDLAKTSVFSSQLNVLDEDEGENVFFPMMSAVYDSNKIVRHIDRFPFLALDENRDIYYNEAFNIQVLGLVKRLIHINCKKVILGISGGLDSTLALLVCLRAMDKMGLPHENILGITMPGFGTSGRTYKNAQILMTKMGITSREISIKEACIQHFKDINHDIDVQDVTYENSQARERTQILMDIANKENALVIGTGDLSELALGWATYNGDHMSMYAMNASVPKTLVQDLVRWAAEKETNEELSKTLLDILDTPISPELKPASEDDEIKQKTEDLVGPYELHDFFLYYTLKYQYSPLTLFLRAEIAFGDKYSFDELKHWMKAFFRRFFSQQFKRSCMPDGPNVTGLSLSPRGAWNMPSDGASSAWLRAIESIEKGDYTSDRCGGFDKH